MPTRKVEFLEIEESAHAHGVDPWFIWAIRQHENGGPQHVRAGGGWSGGEFGIQTVEALTFQAQLEVCCKTVRNAIVGYKGNPLFRITVGRRRGGDPSYRRVAYCADFIRTLARSYCPVGAAEDPTHLNEAWPVGVLEQYSECFSGPEPGE